MSDATSTSNGSSFASSDAASSVCSDNTDSRALNSLNTGADGDSDDLDNSNKSFQEGAFATLYTLTKSRQLDASVRLAVLKVVLEFLQLFRVLFNTSFPWVIQQDLWIFKAVKWVLFRLLVVPAGYATYIIVFYVLGGLVLVNLLAVIWVAVVLKGSDSSSAWLNRMIRGLQMFAMVIYTMFWPAILDYSIFLWDCEWSNLAAGTKPTHIFFPEQSCLAMPHMAHMLCAVVMCIVFGGMTLLMSTGMSDLNPLTRSVLASPDAVSSTKILLMKMFIVMAAGCLDSFPTIQVVTVTLAVVAVCLIHLQDLPYYNAFANRLWTGLWSGLLLVAGLLATLVFSENHHHDDLGFKETLTWAVLYEGDGLDLLGYVEFQRNYRACVRTHKLALMAQRQFWNALLRDSVPFTDLLRKVELMEQAEQRATATYRRVLERYPGNGKVLKVYGRFLEFVRNEPGTAAKYYEEALKQGTSESLLAMTAGQPGGEALAAAVGSIDEKTDGLVIINTQGIILMVNSPVQAMFGYDKGELEGKNVSVLMPPPYSTNHNSFLERFVQTGIPHIANKKRTMVALHKDRSITADCFGLEAAELVGQPFSNLCTDVEGVNRFFIECNSSSLAGHVACIDGGGLPLLKAQIMHSYLPPVDVELSIEFGGALDGQGDCRTITVQAAVLSESAATLVLDHKARVVYATDKLAAMLGYPVASLLKMELGALLPQPTCQIYKPWLNPDMPKRMNPSSCQAGGVVHILAANGNKLPVTLKISTSEDAKGHTNHIVQGDTEIIEHAAALGADSQLTKTQGDASGLLHALQKRDRLRAACMQIDLATSNDDMSQKLLEDATAAAAVPVLQVSLYRADALSSVIELDKHLTIAHADEAAGVMFGINHRHMLRKSFAKLAGLPASSTFEDLLGKTAAAKAKKGAIKTAVGAGGGAGASRVGQTKHIGTACHLADGKPMHIVMQALSYSQGSKTRYLDLPSAQVAATAEMAAAVLMLMMLVLMRQQLPMAEKENHGAHLRSTNPSTAHQSG
ncbi:hypothetical protein OEZ85_003018 [Tetradesmus obliquus]|uniref:PAS domain-containing protein n=1 Tax=Tetradesmus obliquus TaxID=3088 RepID=A0ABY8U224_TETOB|nr:hypothetical protein OEZ85_003018 [Tetradesmus obliquus]